MDAPPVVNDENNPTSRNVVETQVFVSGLNLKRVLQPPHETHAYHANAIKRALSVI